MHTRLQNTKFVLAAIGIAALVMLIPVVMTTMGGTPGCPIGVAGAQDNPCLAQDATISAQEVVILQAQATTGALQATVTSLEAALANVGTTGGNMGDTGSTGSDDMGITTAPGLPFVETFDDNRNGWSLTNGVTLRQGRLVLTSDALAIAPVELPQQSFYLEFNIEGARFQTMYVGDVKNYGTEILLIQMDLDEGDMSVNSGAILQSDGSRTTSGTTIAQTESLGRFTTEDTLGFQYNNGEFQIFVNNELQIIFNATLSGNQLAFKSNGTIDNLTIRTAR